jgi:hypothetical protein
MIKNIIIAILAIIVFIFGYQLKQANYGDLNHDGKVNISDQAILASHYGCKDFQKDCNK